MSGSVTGTDMNPNSETEYTKSESKVAETLAQFEQEHSTPEPPKKSADDSKSTPETEVKDDSEEQESDDNQETADNEDSTPVVKEGDSDDSSDDSKEKPAIPENYYRAAVHQGWKPEQISKLYENDPEGTVDWLKQIHESTNNLTGQFAELGRAKIAFEQEKQKTSAQPKDSKPELDVEKLRERYEDDPVGVMLEIINAKQKPAEQPNVQPVQSNQRDEDMAIAVQLNNFFTNKDLKAYQDFYGSPDEKNPYDWSKTTPGQATNRQAVINEADAILAGYELQGKQISVAEALEKAHLRVSAPIAEKVIREKILTDVKKRSKGITLKPSSRDSKVSATKPEEKSETKAIQTAEAGLKELKEKGF